MQKKAELESYILFWFINLLKIKVKQMKLLKLSTVILTAGLAVGCATNSDIENLQGQLNTLKTDVSSAKSAANSANSAAISV